MNFKTFLNFKYFLELQHFSICATMRFINFLHFQIQRRELRCIRKIKRKTELEQKKKQDKHKQTTTQQNNMELKQAWIPICVFCVAQRGLSFI